MLSTPTCLKLKHDELLSNVSCSAFNCNLRHYTKAAESDEGGVAADYGVLDSPYLY
jgi:hypothetical protein